MFQELPLADFRFGNKRYHLALRSTPLGQIRRLIKVLGGQLPQGYKIARLSVRRQREGCEKCLILLGCLPWRPEGLSSPRDCERQMEGGVVSRTRSVSSSWGQPTQESPLLRAT